MNASSLPLLVFGLLVGLVTGAAIVGLLTRHAREPQILVKITPDALPRRDGGPAAAPGGSRPATGVPVHGGEDPVLRSLAVVAGPAGAAVARAGAPDGTIRVAEAAPLGRIPVMAAAASRPGEANGAGDGHAGAMVSGTMAARAVSDDGFADAGRAAGPTDAAGASGSVETERTNASADLDPLAGEVPARGTAVDAAVSDGGPCSNERRALTERSAIALRAREANRQALDALRAAQRAYDGAEHAIDAATRAIDGRQILDRKRAAQQRFHQVRSAAASPSDVEAAATAWLAEINELNLSVRDGRSILERERRHAGRLLVELEQASGRVDATRIAAEAAEEDVRRARQALADCQEEHLGHESAVAFAALGGHGVGGMGSEAVTGLAPVAAAAAGERADEEAPPSAAPSVLVRILRGDRALLGRVVAVLAGGSDAEAGRWERELGALVDAIVRAAIDDSAIELPRGHPFWGTFTDEQAHEIARALGSLGYRYDGQGGFQDERWPSMRDLSLAIGYTGLDASFIRIWPTEAEMARLYEGSRVAADRLLEARAPDLTLGQMITLLGRAAEALTPIWDEWGRVRPLLASTAT